MENWDKSIFLIDSRYLCYRSSYALMHSDIEDIESSIMFGFTKTLLSIIKGLEIKSNKTIIKPRNIILCWDSKHNYRRITFPWYKDRKKGEMTPYEINVKKEIHNTFPKVMKWMKKIGLVSVVRAGYEADDLFAGYKFEYPEERFVIVSNDSDLYQLLSPNVSMYIHRSKNKSDIFTRENFISKYNIEPKDWITVKAVGGCNSDNIVGVKGIGELRAIKYAKGEMQGKFIFDIAENMDIVERNRLLVELPYLGKKFNDLPLGYRKMDWDAFTRFCQIYSLKSFIVDFSNIRDNFERMIK